MSNTNLSIPLEAKKDKQGNTYYMAKLKGPVVLDAHRGLAFFVFVSESGHEELQVAPLVEKKWENRDNNRESDRDDF